MNSQVTVVLNSIICFSVRFCDNSLLLLGLFFRKRKGRKVYQEQADINAAVTIAVSSAKPCVSFLIF